MSIIEIDKAMIHDLGLPMHLWVETCCTKVDILNMCPHSALKDKTHEEAFIGKKPKVSLFHIFGCSSTSVESTFMIL